MVYSESKMLPPPSPVIHVGAIGSVASMALHLRLVCLRMKFTRFARVIQLDRTDTQGFVFRLGGWPTSKQ